MWPQLEAMIAFILSYDLCLHAKDPKKYMSKATMATILPVEDSSNSVQGCCKADDNEGGEISIQPDL